MAELSKLRLGVAYHSNRILHHVREDMLNIINGNMNTVVHMYTHNDMMRHKNVMRDIVSLSEDLGLEVWVDNWGIDGGPGDKGYFVSINPTERMIFSDGTPHPFKPCYNSEVFFEFTKTWIEHVREAGGKTIFWDEPHLAGDASNFTCCCPHLPKAVCRAFRQTHAHPVDPGGGGIPHLVHRKLFPSGHRLRPGMRHHQHGVRHVQSLPRHQPGQSGSAGLH